MPTEVLGWPGKALARAPWPLTAPEYSLVQKSTAASCFEQNMGLPHTQGFWLFVA